MADVWLSGLEATLAEAGSLSQFGFGLCSVRTDWMRAELECMRISRPRLRKSGGDWRRDHGQGHGVVG